ETPPVPGAALAADAGLLVPVERGARVEGAPVHLDLTGPQAPGPPQRSFRVGRPDPAVEAVLGVVSDPDGVVLILVRHDRQDRAEDLLAGDRHLRGDAGGDGG